MKFYVVEIAEGDDRIKGKGIYEYSSQKEALASFHKKLGTAMSSDLYTSELLVVLDESGSPIALEKYNAEQPTEEKAE